MRRRFVANNFLFLSPLHAKGLRCRSCNKALHHQNAIREYEKNKREQPNFDLEDNNLPWHTNPSIQDPLTQPNANSEELLNYHSQIVTSYGVPNRMKVLEKDLKHSTPSAASLQFHSNFQWHSLNSPNKYDMRFGSPPSLYFFSKLQGRINIIWGPPLVTFWALSLVIFYLSYFFNF